MAYLEPASNSGLKPQSLSDKKRKNKTKLVGISCKLLTKNSIYKELKIRINTCDKMWLHAYIQPINVSSAL